MVQRKSEKPKKVKLSKKQQQFYSELQKREGESKRRKKR